MNTLAQSDAHNVFVQGVGHLPDLLDALSNGEGLRTTAVGEYVELYLRDTSTVNNGRKAKRSAVVHLTRDCEASRAHGRSFSRWSTVEIQIEDLPTRICSRCASSYGTDREFRVALLHAAAANVQRSFRDLHQHTAGVRSIVQSDAASEHADALDVTRLQQAALACTVAQARFATFHKLVNTHLADYGELKRQRIVDAVDEAAALLSYQCTVIKDAVAQCANAVDAAFVVQHELRAVTAHTIPAFTTVDTAIMEGTAKFQLTRLFDNTCATARTLLDGQPLTGTVSVPPIDKLTDFLNTITASWLNDIDQLDFPVDEPVTIAAGCTWKDVISSRWRERTVNAYTQAFTEWTEFISTVLNTPWPTVHVTATRPDRGGIDEVVDNSATYDWRTWCTHIDFEAGSVTWTVPAPIAEHILDQFANSTVIHVTQTPAHSADATALAAIQALRPADVRSPLRSWTVRANIATASMVLPAHERGCGSATL